MLQIPHYLIILVLEAADIFECLPSCINHKKVGRPINLQIQDKSIIFERLQINKFSAVAGTNQVSALFNVYRGFPALQNARFLRFYVFRCSRMSHILNSVFMSTPMSSAGITQTYNYARRAYIITADFILLSLKKTLSNKSRFIGPNHNQNTESTIFRNIRLTIFIHHV